MTEQRQPKLTVNSDMIDKIIASEGLRSDAELCRVTGISTRTLTRVRNQEVVSHTFLAKMLAHYGEKYPNLATDLLSVAPES